jgi:alpha-1,3-mannosyltransferase
VNWRFLGEETFLSQGFARALLAAHATLLFLFMVSRWLHAPLTGAIDHLTSPPPPEIQRRIAKRVTPDFVLTTILTAVIIGCVCARTLHYQFYAYIAWSTPFLLWRSGLHPVLFYAIWAAQEWAWNVYPSTNISSVVVVVCLKITMLAIFSGTEDEEVAPPQSKKVQDQKSE